MNLPVFFVKKTFYVLYSFFTHLQALSMEIKYDVVLTFILILLLPLISYFVYWLRPLNFNWM